MNTAERSEVQAALEGAERVVAGLKALLARTAAPAAAPSAPAVQPAVAGLADPGAFFDVLRGSDVLGPQLTHPEVDGTNAILAAGTGKLPLSWMAYALATAYHETAHTMQPVKEYGGEAYYRRMYDIQGARPDKARELGNLTPGDGVKYAGRGYVQLTGRVNYARAEKELGLPLVDQPDLAMQPAVASQIMVRGMTEGWFTGKTLNHYLRNPADRKQFAAARRIINGTDKADLIAGYAEVFQKALQVGGWR